MIYVSESLVNLYISVWGETWRGRLDGALLQPDPDGPRSLKDIRKEAHLRHMVERPILQTEHWATIFEAAAGYEEVSDRGPYTGPSPYIGRLMPDDPDPRLFLLLTVEVALQGVRPKFRALAEHSWVYRRGDRDFRYQPADGEGAEDAYVPTGRSLVDWCKHARSRTIRPAISRAIGSSMPETIVETTLMQLQDKIA